jgi:hypothetical protein
MKDLFDLYNILASWVGWPALTLVLILAGSFALWIQKRHIDILKERNEYLRDQNANLSNFSSDTLVRALSDRVRISNEELERLRQDQENNQALITQKESELDLLRTSLAVVNDQLSQAEEIVKAFTCPYCGARQESHEFYPTGAEVNGTYIDYEIETIQYACGLEIRDGVEIRKCKWSQNPGSEK